MAYVKQNHWVSGHCPSWSIPRNPVILSDNILIQLQHCFYLIQNFDGLYGHKLYKNLNTISNDACSVVLVTMPLPVINTSSRHVEHGAIFPVENWPTFRSNTQPPASGLREKSTSCYLLLAGFLLCLLFATFYRDAPPKRRQIFSGLCFIISQNIENLSILPLREPQILKACSCLVVSLNTLYCGPHISLPP